MQIISQGMLNILKKQHINVNSSGLQLLVQTGRT